MMEESEEQEVMEPFLLEMIPEDVQVLRNLHLRSLMHGSPMYDDVRQKLLMAALHLSNREMIRYLNPHILSRVEVFLSNKPWPLHFAIAKNDLPSMSLLIDSGADMNVLNHLGQSPLHLACALDYFPNAGIDHLLKAGADSNKKNCKGFTPLHIAAVMKRPSVIELLINHGADINQRNNYSQTSLSLSLLQVPSWIFLPVHVKRERWLSADSFCRLCAQVLLKAGFDIKRATIKGLPLLNRTILAGRPLTLPLLLKHGADINEPEKCTGRTPLMITVPSKYIGYVDELLKNGAYVNAKCKKGNTALHYSAAHGYCADKINLLISSGADAYALNNNNQRFLEMFPNLNSYATALFDLIGKCVYPSEVESRDLSRFDISAGGCISGLAPSPLFLALSLGKTDTAAFLTNIGFLTRTDILWMSNNGDVRKRISSTNPRTFDGMTNGPCSLKLISFVRISDMLGATADRKDKVQKLGLPVPLQERLLFKHGLSTCGRF